MYISLQAYCLILKSFFGLKTTYTIFNKHVDTLPFCTSIYKTEIHNISIDKTCRYKHASDVINIQEIIPSEPRP